MKKLLCVVVILLIISSSVALADSSIKIDELGATIYPPQGFTTITRNASPDDECFKKIGADGVTFLENIKSSDIYLCSISDDQMTEIIVTMLNNSSSKSLYDFNLLSNEQLEEFANEIVGMDNDEILKSAKINKEEDNPYNNISLSNYLHYEHDQVNFIVLDSYLKIDNKPIYGRQYTTIVNGQTVKVLLNSYGQKISPDVEKMLHDMVGSIEFDEIKDKPENNGIPSFGKVLAAFRTALTIGGIFFISCVLILKFRKIREQNKKKGM